MGEKFDLRYDLPGVLLTCTGSILTVLNANKVEQDYTLDLLQEYLLTPKSMLYVAILVLNTGASLVCLYMLSTWLPPIESAFKDTMLYKKDEKFDDIKALIEEGGFKQDTNSPAVLIDIMNKLSYSQMKRISGSKDFFFHSINKIPMIFLIITASTLSGFNLAIFKLAGLA